MQLFKIDEASTKNQFQNPFTTIQPIHRYSIVRLCTTTPDKDQSKTITERFTESMRVAAEQQKLTKANRKKNNGYTEFKGIKPKDDYKPRFEYNGYLKKCNWKYFDDETHPMNKDDIVLTEAQLRYRDRKKRKFCLLLGFAGGNYFGMQYNATVNTIEDQLLNAMCKNEWILEEHIRRPVYLEFQHGSRTDRGVSAARMNCSLMLRKFFCITQCSIFNSMFIVSATDVNIDDINRDLPSDIRLFGMKRVTRKFSARHNCSARTYSYTLPTIALAPYNDQTELHEYRIPADRLQRTNEILSLFKGQTNFHNYTVKKLHFDRSAQRRIDTIECGEPFIESGIEFARITVKGESFMYHQIRKMVGFSLAVIRGIVSDDLLARSLTKEEFNTPLAPGLGLMLERLHYTNYSQIFKEHDPLTFEECDEAVEKFRREMIHPVIVDTEVRENSMREWLELLCTHTFDKSARLYEEERRYQREPDYSDEWGEDPEFLKKLNEKCL